MHGLHLRRTRLIALLLGIAFPAIAHGSATQTDGTLIIVLDFVPPIPNGPEPFDQSATIVVDSGKVTISGVPDDATGTLFDGEMFSEVDAILVDSGAGNDKVSFEVVTTQNLDIAVDSTGGQAETKINMMVPSGASAFASTIDLDFGNLEDKLELELDSQRHTNLILNAMGSSGEKSIGVKAMYGSGTNVGNVFDLDLGGSEDETSIEIKSEADSLTNEFSIDSGGGEDQTKIVMEHLGTDPFDNSLVLTHGAAEDSTDIIIKSMADVGLSGMISSGGGVFGDDDKINIEVDAPNTNLPLPDVDMTSLSIMSGTGRDELNVSFKGSLDLSGALTLSAGDGDDKLKLLVEGGLDGAGSAVLDGGNGFDECEASQDPMIVLIPFPSCDIAKQ